MKKGKAWMTDLNPVQVQLPQEQVSVTIYGAIGTPLESPLFMLGKYSIAQAQRATAKKRASRGFDDT